MSCLGLSPGSVRDTVKKKKNTKSLQTEKLGSFHLRLTRLTRAWTDQGQLLALVAALPEAMKSGCGNKLFKERGNALGRQPTTVAAKLGNRCSAEHTHPSSSVLEVSVFLLLH